MHIVHSRQRASESGSPECLAVKLGKQKSDEDPGISVQVWSTNTAARLALQAASRTALVSHVEDILRVTRMDLPLFRIAYFEKKLRSMLSKFRITLM
jgi:hypothetical protein